MTLEVNKTSKQEEDKKQLADLGNAYRAGCYFEQIPDGTSLFYYFNLILVLS